MFFKLVMSFVFPGNVAPFFAKFNSQTQLLQYYIKNFIGALDVPCSTPVVSDITVLVKFLIEKMTRA